MTKINWSNVFNTTHKHFGWFATAYELAKDSGYPYFIWNDKIFFTSNADDTGWVFEDGEFVDKTPNEEDMLFV